ncbi:MAG: hypothetical protein KAT39_14475 [Alphaproteobacteria bacterium]|nr:hypothetical protein [Alphaproteobacteria bacterium]
MSGIVKWGGQTVIYAGMALWLGYFANMPVYTHLDPKLAVIKLSVVHSAQRKYECRKRTQEELEAMNPNMRKPLDCPRERLPIHLELLLDGVVVYDEMLQPAGLSRGSQARAYKRLPTTAGQHEIVVRMVDSARTEGYDYSRAAQIILSPGENFVIDFRADSGGFEFIGLAVDYLPES